MRHLDPLRSRNEKLKGDLVAEALISFSPCFDRSRVAAVAPTADILRVRTPYGDAMTRGFGDGDGIRGVGGALGPLTASSFGFEAFAPAGSFEHGRRRQSLPGEPRPVTSSTEQLTQGLC